MFKAQRQVTYMTKAFKATSLILGLTACLLPLNAHAVHKSQGWQWYNTGYIDYDNMDEKPMMQPQQPQKSAVERLREFQAVYEEVNAEAVLNPTPENEAKAMAMRQYMYEKSKQLGVAHKQALLMFPELDYQLKFPTQQSAQKIMDETHRKDQVQAIKHLGEKYGMFFFYKSNDVYAQAMAKSVQSFADQYNIKLIGISVDGIFIPEIADNRLNQGQSERFNVRAYPALFLIDPKAGTSYPLAYGYISNSELLQRFYDVATNYGTKEIPNGK